MRACSKWISMLLCILMAAMLPLASLAEDVPSITAAMQNGREASYHGTMEWKSVPGLLDEETNTLIAAIMEAATFEGRVANLSASEGYMDFALMLSGERAVPFTAIYRDGVAYFNTPIYGEPFMLAFEDLQTFFTKMGTYVESMNPDITEGTFSEMYADLFEGVYMPYEPTAPAVDIEELSGEELLDALREAYAPYGMEGIVDVSEAWTKDELLTGAVELDSLQNTYGIEVDSAVAYPITKEMLIDLVAGVAQSLRDSDSFMAMMAQGQVQTSSVSVIGSGSEYTTTETTSMTIEELREAFDEEIAELLENLDEIPDEMEAALAYGYDADGNELIGVLDVYVPAEEEEEDFILYAEGLADSVDFYMEMGTVSDMFVLNVEPNAPLADDTPDNGFTAVLTILNNEEEMGGATLQTSSVSQKTDDGFVWDGSLTVGLMDQGMDITLSGIANQVTTMQGEDVTKDTNVDINLMAYGATLPIMSANFLAETAEPGDMPFDIDEIDFIEPVNMDDAEFTRWMNGVAAGMMKTFMRAASLLPDDVYLTMIEEGMASVNY